MSFLWPYFARRPSRISRIRWLNCPGLVKMRFGGGKNSIVLNLLPFENSSRPLRATFHESTINISRNIYIYIYESFVASNKESQQDSKRISNSERNSPHLLQRFVTHRLMDSRSVIPLWNRSLDSIELVSPIVLLHTRYVIGNCFQKREMIFQRYIYGDEYIFFFRIYLYNQNRNWFNFGRSCKFPRLVERRKHRGSAAREKGKINTSKRNLI